MQTSSSRSFGFRLNTARPMLSGGARHAVLSANRFPLLLTHSAYSLKHAPAPRLVHACTRRAFSSAKKRRPGASRFEQWSRQHDKRRPSKSKRPTASSASKRAAPQAPRGRSSASASSTSSAGPSASDFAPEDSSSTSTSSRTHAHSQSSSAASGSKDSSSDSSAHTQSSSSEESQSQSESKESKADDEAENWQGWQPYKHGREGIYFFHDGRRSRTSNWVLGLVVAAFAGLWYAGHGQNWRMGALHARPTVLVVAVTDQADLVSAYSIFVALRQCATKNLVSVGFSEDKKLVAESTELQVKTALKGAKSKPSAILLYIDSSAGAGHIELEGVNLCEQVKAVAEDLAVPVYAYIHGSATGSTYELASCADKIIARQNAEIGGIGNGAEQLLGVSKRRDFVNSHRDAIALETLSLEGGTQSVAHRVEQSPTANRILERVLRERSSALSQDALKSGESLRGQTFSSEEAQEVGLVDELVHGPSLLAATLGFDLAEEKTAAKFIELRAQPDGILGQGGSMHKQHSMSSVKQQLSEVTDPSLIRWRIHRRWWNPNALFSKERREFPRTGGLAI